MRLHEYQAKQIFSQHGIKIPKGRLATSLNDVRKISEELDGNVVLKSQILVGGRGKAGGIKKAKDVNDTVNLAKKLFGATIKGHVVNRIYVEETLNVERELYLGFTYDGVNKCISMIISQIGGMNIEEIAAKYPDMLVVKYIDPIFGLWDYIIREALYEAQIPKESFRDIFSIVKRLYQTLVKYDAELCEINPLAITINGEVFAMDARLNIDDDAMHRHKELLELKDYTQANPLEKTAEQAKLRYVKMDGNVGVIAAGAGMGMATADLIHINGGKPANFLDVGGADPEVVKKSMELLLKDKDVNLIFVNVLGGLTRCDWVADGIIKTLNELKISLPIVIRLAGTNENEGRAMLQKYIVENKIENVVLAETMEEGAEKAVKLAQ